MAKALPTCEHRGDPVATGKRERYPCSHPKVSGSGKPKLVLEVECQECRFGPWEPEAAVARMEELSRRFGAMPKQAMVRRLLLCGACRFRDGDYCVIAKGCRLTTKLMRPEFACPEGVFPKVQR